MYEVARYRLDESGKNALTALQRTMGRYSDCFLHGSGLGLRNDNYLTSMADCYIYPKYTVIPKLRCYGLKGSFADIAPQKLIKNPVIGQAVWKRYLKVDANGTSNISSTIRRIWISVGRPIKSCYARNIG